MRTDIEPCEGTGVLTMAISKQEFPIGALLVQMELVADTALQHALSVSSHTGLPIGKTLVALDYIPDRVLFAAIEAQSMLRDGLISNETARSAMKKVISDKQPFSDALLDLGFEIAADKRNRLGEMLVDSGLLKRDQLDFGLTVAQSSGMPLGQILVLLNRISDSLLRFALALQQEVRAQSIKRENAIQRLKRGSAGSETMDNAPSTPPYKVKLGKLIYLAGLITHEMLLSALRASRASRRLLGQYLIENRLISAEQLNLALCLQKMVWEGRITHTAAAKLLENACRQNNPAFSAEEQVISLDTAHSITFFDFLRISGYLTAEKISTVLDRIPNEPKLRMLVYNQTFDRRVAENLSRSDMALSLKNPAVLRYALSKSFPQDQRLVNCALILFTLSASRAISLTQALVNFGVEWNCRETAVNAAN